MIRIAAITLASDSAITIARFRPSKVPKLFKSRIVIVMWEGDSGWMSWAEEGREEGAITITYDQEIHSETNQVYNSDRHVRANYSKKCSSECL